MLKIRGKINGRNEVSEVVLHKGQLEGDTDLVMFIKRLSAEYEAFGVVPVINYTPDTNDYWKDVHALMYMVNQICTEVKTNQRLKPMDDTRKGAES